MSAINCLIILILSFFNFSIASEVKSNYLIFNFSQHNSNLNHRESSANTSFVSLNRLVKHSLYSGTVGVGKEIFAEQYISITPFIYIGAELGRTKDDVKIDNLRFREKVYGFQYGFGGSLNINVKALKLRFQPFGIFRIEQIQTKYRLDYGRLDSSTLQVSIHTKEEGVKSHIGGGLRIFDNTQSLFSTFAIEYATTDDLEKAVERTRLNQSHVVLENIVPSEQKPWTFTLGFGVMF